MSEATEQQLRAAFGALSSSDMRLIKKYSHPLNKKEPSLNQKPLIRLNINSMIKMSAPEKLLLKHYKGSTEDL